MSINTSKVVGWVGLCAVVSILSIVITHILTKRAPIDPSKKYVVELLTLKHAGDAKFMQFHKDLMKDGKINNYEFDILLKIAHDSSNK